MFFLEEKVPIINFALGKGGWIVGAAKKYGAGRLLPRLSMLDMARGLRTMVAIQALRRGMKRRLMERLLLPWCLFLR